jgi:predicted 3-demethylubiquinone-9 3-methyltransferase (glyoxalase superfamily)
MISISPCLWFDGQAEQAATFYVSLFPDSRIDSVTRAPGDYPAGKQGDVLIIMFTLAGRRFQALNGGSAFKFNEAISLSISVDGQSEVDRLWEALTADGGSPGQCGWLKDKYGLSWQVVPREMERLMDGPDASRAKRAMQAMMTMTKIDLAAISEAADGDAP